MIGWMNLVSLVLGLVAWILPIIYIIRKDKFDQRNWIVYFVMSTSSCTISLLIQIYVYYFMVRNEDFSALIDTNGVVAFSATVLFIVTIVLNTIGMAINLGRVKK